jgi:ABC-type branched-subunit amino acid transport system substrate-binding protein
MLGLALVACFACSPPPPPSTNELKIGALLPYTGDLAASGINLEHALIMAAESINKQGGVLDRPIRIVARDTHSDVEVGLQVGQALLDDVGVSAIIGPEDPDLASKLALITEARKVIQISGGPTSVPPPEGGAFAFRIVPPAVKMAESLAGQIKTDGKQRVAIVHIDDEYGRAFSQALALELAKKADPLDPTIQVSQMSFIPGPSHAELINQVRLGMPDAIVLVAYSKAGARVIQDWALSGGNETWYFAPSLRTDSFLRNVPPGKLEGMVGVSAALPADQEKFAQAFKARWQTDYPLTNANFYFDALVVFALAMEAARTNAQGATPTPEAVRAQMRLISGPAGTSVTWDHLDEAFRLVRQGTDIDYRGASGPVDFNGAGDVALGFVQLWAIHSQKAAPL